MHGTRLETLELSSDEPDKVGLWVTFLRLSTSRHLGDLQGIALALLVTLLVVAVDRIVTHDQWSSLAVGSGALALLAAVLNWIYQTGSRRIGTVDMFACEIDVLCRVMLVSNFARTSVDRAYALEKAKADEMATAAGGEVPAERPSVPLALRARCGAPKFTSEEHYTPVYDQHLADLAPLDTNVITSVTEFYTYRKTMTDGLRAAAAVEDLEDACAAASRMIYMQFLMYESARKAIGALIEAKPAWADATVSILCSELVTYAYVLRHYADDYRGARLALRRNDYRKTVIELLELILKNTQGQKVDRAWIRARTSGRELLARYRAACADIGLDPKIPSKLLHL
jgi:hypothetical protein